jgi:hypothetical protein
MAIDDEAGPTSTIAGGFNRIARDLDRAISVAGFTAAQHLLIAQAREQAWGPATVDNGGEAVSFTLNLSGLARVSGLDRSNLSNQFRALVGFRVFLDQGDGSYRINKLYRKWRVADGSPRLSRDQISWCLECRRKGAK